MTQTTEPRESQDSARAGFVSPALRKTASISPFASQKKMSVSTWVDFIGKVDTAIMENKILIDDSGWGFPLGGVLCGAYNTEKAEFNDYCFSRIPFILDFHLSSP